jgi:hypothetical protein
LSEHADKTSSNTNEAISKLFSPQSLSFIQFQESTSNNQEIDSYSWVKEDEVHTEGKIVCMKYKMALYKFMLTSEHSDKYEKRGKKRGLTK